VLWLSKFCEANRYGCPQVLPGGRYACLSPFLFTVAIITGDLGDEWGYRDRWCYENSYLAAAALVEWGKRNYEGEPIGWHRHPDSGRRRPGGDASNEYINR
jgi:hypothetical protein